MISQQEELLKAIREDFSRQITDGCGLSDSQCKQAFTDLFPVYGTVDLCPYFTVIDFGCGKALQSAFFGNCQRYIGVDSSAPEERFSPDNAEHFQMSTQEFIQNELPALKQRIGGVFQIYAICPSEQDETVQKLIADTFPFARVMCHDTIITDRKPPVLNNFNCMRLIDELANLGVIQRDPERKNNVIIYFSGDDENPEGWYSQNIWQAAEDLLHDGESQRFLINELNQTYEQKHIEGRFMQKDIHTFTMSPVLERESLANEYTASRDVPASGKKKNPAERENE
jgi:hypothetical protein